MIKRISTVYPLDERKLLVWFEGGESRVFDCAANLSEKELAALHTRKMFETARVTADGYAVSWGADIDITSKELFDKGVFVDVSKSESMRVVAEIALARKQRGLSQAQLESASGVRQPVIARTEKGVTAPRLDTLMKLLAPLGKTLRVVDASPSLAQPTKNDAAQDSPDGVRCALG